MTDKKRKTIVILLIMLSVNLVALAGVLAWYGYDSTSYSRHITRAQKYISAGNYDQAILEYQAAIQKNPQTDTAYELLADVYNETGQREKAESTLKEGIQKTGSKKLSAKVEVIMPIAGGQIIPENNNDDTSFYSENDTAESMEDGDSAGEDEEKSDETNTEDTSEEPVSDEKDSEKSSEAGADSSDNPDITDNTSEITSEEFSEDSETSSQGIETDDNGENFTQNDNPSGENGSDDVAPEDSSENDQGDNSINNNGNDSQNTDETNDGGTFSEEEYISAVERLLINVYRQVYRQ